MFRVALTFGKSVSAAAQQSAMGACLRTWAAQLECATQASCRRFSSMPDPDPESNPSPSQTVLDVVDRIENLTVKDMVWLNKLLKERLGITDDVGMMMAQPMPMAAPAAAAAPAAPPVPEKTEFKVLVESYDAAAKIKIIKEVRAILPDLGLKDAKDLVDKIPATIKTGLSKSEADELKKRLEAGARSNS